MARPLKEQVIVITGASSGIGRETALTAGKRGASVVLAARSEDALQKVAEQIERSGGRALAVSADVSDFGQMKRLAQKAVDHFGRIDTWVNNASVSTYATIEETTPEEMDRTVEVNLMGTIYGTKAALPHMKRQRSGTIINVASVLAERSVPLLSGYCAAKHGVKGFTESLRLEMEREKTGIAVTLILPSSINTPFFDHARSRLGVKPRPIPPVYEPSAVAEAILSCAEKPRRDVFVGGAGKMFAFLESLSAPLLDRYMLQGDRAAKQQKSEQADDKRDNLFHASEGPHTVQGSFTHLSKGPSLYTKVLELHPNRKRLLFAAAALGAAYFVNRARRNGSH